MSSVSGLKDKPQTVITFPFKLGKILFIFSNKTTTCGSEDEGAKVSELRQVIGSYGRLALGKPLWRVVRHFKRPAPQNPSVLPPDVALLELLGSPARSHADLVSTRLVLALELMNIVAAYMILRDSGQVLDVQQAVQLADALESAIGSVSTRLALVRHHLRSGSLRDAATTLEEAACLAQRLGRRVPCRLLAARSLCRLIAGKAGVPTSPSRYNFRTNAVRLLVCLLLADSVR